MNQNGRIQIVFRRSSPATKIVASVAIVLSILALVALRWAQNDIEERTKAMQNEAAHLVGENQELQDRIDGTESIEDVLEIAEEELGLVDPDTVIIETD